METEFTGHRGFAWFWSHAVKYEGQREREKRQEVAAPVRGRALELGVGVGTNWQYLDPGVDYVGIEPDPYMRQRALENAKEDGRGFEVIDAVAEELPFNDAEFDTVFTTLTFCSVQQPQKALAEVMRVLKSGGEFRFFEHVLPDNRVLAPLFETITPAWKRIGGGCHPNRRTLQRINRAGFHVIGLDRDRVGPIPFVTGVARKP